MAGAQVGVGCEYSGETAGVAADMSQGAPWACSAMAVLAEWLGQAQAGRSWDTLCPVHLGGTAGTGVG